MFLNTDSTGWSQRKPAAQNNRKIKARCDCLGAARNLVRALPIIAWTLLLVISAPALALSRDDYCADRLSFELAQPSSTPRGTRYVNSTYGYSVAIPTGSQLLTRADAPERGFFLALARTPRGYLRVDAAYDVFYDITAEGVHRRDLNAIRLHDAVLEEQSVAVQLAREPALHSVVRLKCRGHTETLVHESIVTVRRREIYRLDLLSAPERLAEDERLFERLWRSWRWEPLR